MHIILGLLGLLFVGLKLTGYIDWSWWYVTMPFYGGAIMGVVLLIIAAIAATLVQFIGDWHDRN